MLARAGCAASETTPPPFVVGVRGAKYNEGKALSGLTGRPLRPPSTRLDCGRSARAAQLLRRIAGGLCKLPGKATRLPFRSTRGPDISTVPEIAFCECASTALS